MALNINPIKIKGANCFEDCFATILNYYNHDYMLLFNDSWGFLLNSDFDYNKSIAYSFSTEKIDLIKKTQELFGLSFRRKEEEAFEDSLKNLKQELNKQHPIILFYDGYYLPWDDIYNKRHFYYHSLLAVGYDNNYLYCSDPYRDQSENKLALEFTPEGYGGFLSFETMDTKNARDILKDSLLDILLKKNSSRENNMFTNMRHFAEIVTKYLDLNKEFEGHKDFYWTAPLVLQLFSIAESRNLFSTYLKYFSEKNNYCVPLALCEDFVLISLKWSNIVAILVKGIMQEIDSQTIATKISKKIIKIADYEEKLMHDLIEVLKNPKTYSTPESNTYTRSVQIMKTKGRPQQIYTEEQKAVIKKAYKETHNPKDRSRLLCIKLRIVQGLTIEHISNITEYSCSTVSHLISSYNRYGMKEMLVKKYGGNHGRCPS